MKQYVASDDPLGPDAIAALLAHREEDQYVDYKEDFDPVNEKHWLGVTADAMSFANTFGGYLVFGVADRTFAPKGLNGASASALANTTMVLQKLNRFVRPAFTGVRTKAVEKDGLRLVVWYVPESRGQTHIVVKDGRFRMQNNEWKYVLRPGMIFSRRSATNHIVEPEDLELIINRRMEYVKSGLLDKIAKVVEAPPEQEVLLFDPESTSADGRTFVISDAPDAVAVKGLSFTVSPRTDIEELASWVAMSGRDPGFRPRTERLWALYADRKDLRPSQAHVAELIRFSLLCEVPVFYWMAEQSPEVIKQVLLRSITEATTIGQKANIIHVGAFLGKGLFRSLKSKIGKASRHLDPKSKKFPAQGPRVFFHPELASPPLKKRTRRQEESFRLELEEKLDGLSRSISEGSSIHMGKATAVAIDCYLYALNDGYRRNK